MAPKARSRVAASSKRKYDDVREESEDAASIASSSGSELTEDEYHEESAEEDDQEDEDDEDYDEEPPKKSRKTNGNGKTPSPKKSKSIGKTPTPTSKTKPKSKNKAKEELESDEEIETSKSKSKVTSKSDSKTKIKKEKTKKELDEPEVLSRRKLKMQEKVLADAARTRTKNPKALLEYLLSDEALDLSNPHSARGYGEVDWSKHTSPSNPKSEPDAPKPKPKASRKQKKESEQIHPSMTEEKQKEEEEKNAKNYIRYPHSKLTPFQVLLCSVLLSKPLSHKLGLRTISTLLNSPYNFGEFSQLEKQTQSDQGEEFILESLFKARTQHKEKTTTQLLNFCQGVKGLNGENEEGDLGGIKRAIQSLNGNVEAAQKRVGEMISTIMGIGPVGVSIFLRRIQNQWKEVFPYVDQRCLIAAKSVGLIKENGTTLDMANLVDNNPDKLVRLLDTLIGFDLEKKLDEVVAKFP
ncbi:uncharacterized protein L201_002761 [Kwoniella dendrophila CBS 6074]|uniref:HhH-GPD domain-containing protein n=1 Tax=Kwoniella dendrophila CBS 6074 TaxID=1295534 RepID=A0AAX4JSY5_9TREE